MNINKSNDKLGWNLENTYANLDKILFNNEIPRISKDPNIVLFNDDLSSKLGLDKQLLNSKLGAQLLSGNQLIENSIPIAQAYAGHQYGHFTMLGDGRAILLGEQITPDSKRYDIQLKGSGRTKYSRGGDGLATLSSMLREYIISEAMHALNISTTRSLAVVSSGEGVMRDRSNDGAILTRVSKSHIRIATFQFANSGEFNTLKELSDYVIKRLYPECLKTNNPYLELLKIITLSQAKLIAQWQSVGFIHGVMNTDNMSIASETIDYGPCAFMNIFDPETVFSSIDKHGRYAYKNQPNIAQWNLARFAETLLKLIDTDKDTSIKLAEGIINSFPDMYKYHYYEIMKSKIGIFSLDVEKNYNDDKSLIDQLLDIMYKNKLDYTNTFVNLIDPNFTSNIDELNVWIKKWKLRLSLQRESFDKSIKLMKLNNPYIIPRNHIVENALKSATSDKNFEPLNNLLKVLSSPFDYSIKNKEYTSPPVNEDNYKTYCGT